MTMLFTSTGTENRKTTDRRSRLARGLRAFTSGNDAVARRLLAPLAARGHPEAGYLLSCCSRPRESARQFEARLVAGTQNAANRGHAPAMYLPAMWLGNGEYVDQDVGRSRALIKACAAKAYAPGQHYLGCALFYGTAGETQDVAAGLELLEASVRQDYEGGLRSLASILREGSNGVPVDEARATALLARAETTSFDI